ncbi:MAG: STAS domain-containing protein [Candidatus Latescibacteria bacterium]|nr:STAS domain-containing protein [Candidatus Latescibacterota bacterium]
MLKIEGRLEGESVVLLAAEGEGHLQQTERLVLEIDEVKFIDHAGIQLLQRWARKRLVLQGGSPFVQVLLKEHGLS